MIGKEYEINFVSPVAICDIEISNDIKQPDGSWDYEKSNIVTLGILYGNKIRIIQRESKDTDGNWRRALQDELYGMPVMFSLNTKMEKYGLKGFLGLNLFFEEIQPMRGSGCSKDNFFKDLIENGIIPKENVPVDPFNGDSRLVLKAYADKNYKDIIEHNKNCLIKEYYIFMNRFWFLEKYKEFLNGDWWEARNKYGDGEPINKSEEND